MNCPDHIDPRHWQEWLDSGVSPEIIAANVRSLSGYKPHEYLLYSPELDRRNDGRLIDKWLRTYVHLEDGGWWCSGLDPLNNWEPMTWGCFKPDRPRIDFEKRKPLKYENPPRTPTRALFLDVPSNPRLWLEVLANPATPIVFVEGSKKAGCLLRLGYIAIALPGVNGGYRNIDGVRSLMSDLKRFCVPGRRVILAFDQDEKAKTRTQVNQALFQFGRLLNDAGCEVAIAAWDGSQGKGPDDLVVNAGVEAWEQSYDQALSWEQWKHNPRFSLPVVEKLTADLVGEERYISTLMDKAKAEGLTQDKKLIVVCSAHGTGKTHWLKNGFFAPYQKQDIPVWALTYRQSLENSYGRLFGIPTRAESAQFRDSIAVTGATMCIHSMHPNSMAQFNGEESPLGPVSLDEVRGVLQELVDSPLVKRSQVLSHFTAHLRRCIEAGFPIVALDAAATDLEVNCLMKLLGLQRHQVLVVQNNFQLWQGRQVHLLDEPAAGVIELRKFLRKLNHGPILVTTSGQKLTSSYGSQTLESLCKSIDKKLKILRVDSETVHRLEHPAAKLMTLLESAPDLVNEFLKQFDAVIFSPVIESGVSIELYGHFTAQFSFVSGGLPAEAVAQQMLRLRDSDVPIYLASPDRGMACCLKRGNGAVDLKTLCKGETERQKGNFYQLLVPTDGGIDLSFVEYWLAIAARQNGSIFVYKDLLKYHLERVGCTVEAFDSDTQKEELKAQKKELKIVTVNQGRGRGEEVAAAEQLDPGQYEKLRRGRFKSQEEARAIERHELKERYSGLEVDEVLVRVDMEDRQLKPQVLLEFYLGIGRASLKPDEQETVNQAFEEGPAFGPDLNRKLIGHKVLALELLGIADLLKREGEQLTNQDELIQQIGDLMTRYEKSVQTTLGINLSQKKDTVWKINRLCDELLGWRLLERVRTMGSRGELRQVVYEVMTAATSSTFQARAEGLTQLAAPEELLEIRQRFMHHLEMVHQSEPVAV